MVLLFTVTVQASKFLTENNKRKEKQTTGEIERRRTELERERERELPAVNRFGAADRGRSSWSFVRFGPVADSDGV